MWRSDATLVNSPSLTLEEVEAIVDEAHRLGLRVACHTYGGEGMKSCLSAGVDSPNHLLELDDAGVKLLLQKKLFFVPTIDDLISLEKADLRETGGRNSRLRLMEQAFKKALAAGVTIVFGSGATSATIPHGRQADQFAYFVKWGMTPVQALQTAYLPVALVQRDMADFRAAHRQIENGPRVDTRIELDDAVRGPQVAPRVVLAVDGDVIRLHRGIRQRDDRRLESLRIDLRPRRAVRIDHPQQVGVFVGAHAARTLRPRQRSVEAQVADGFVEGAVLAEQAIDLDVGHLDLDRLAGGDVALVDSIHRHLRPPAVAVAIAGRAVGRPRASRIALRDRRFEFGERLGHRIEAHGTDWSLGTTSKMGQLPHDGALGLDGTI